MLTESGLHGIYVPIVTPFDTNGELDVKAFDNLTRQLIAKGIQGLIINGTTGESPTMEAREVELLTYTARKAAEAVRKIPIVVGTGTNSTLSTVRKTEQAGLNGADAVLVVVPYYNRPSQQGIIEHFRRVAEVGVPVIMYDVPHRTGAALELDTIRTLMELDSIIGLKDSTGSVKMVAELSRLGSKPVLCGDDELFLAALCSGARGGMLASANVETGQFVQVYDDFQSGRIKEANQSFDLLLPLIRLLFSEPNPAPLKWLLARRGIISTDELRPPMVTISHELKHLLTPYH